MKRLTHLREAKNLISLAAIQGGNALIPLIMFPYFLSKLGPQNFSQLAALEAASFILLTFSLYSFDVSGLKKINNAKRIGNHSLARTHYSILYARLIIFLPCALLLVLLTFFFERNLSLVSLVWLFFPLGVVLQSSYFYQATSNNLPLALFVVTPRIASCIIAFTYTNEDTSLLFASSLISLSYFASGVASSIYMYKTLGFRAPNRLTRTSLALIRQGRHLFVGGLSVLLYRGSNTLLLTALSAPPSAISVYAIAEKYVKMLQAITFPITQLFAVRLVRDITDSGHGVKPLRQILWANTKHQVTLAVAIATAFSLACVTIAPSIDWAIPEQALHLMLVMIPATVLGIVNYMYGTLAFSSLNMESFYAKMLLLCGISTITVSAILIHYFSAVGAAAAYTFAEALLTGGFLLKLRKIS